MLAWDNTNNKNRKQRTSGSVDVGNSDKHLDGAESAPKPEKVLQPPRETRQIEAEKRDFETYLTPPIAIGSIVLVIAAIVHTLIL